VDGTVLAAEERPRQSGARKLKQVDKDTTVEDEAPDSKVQKIEGRRFEARRVMGIFWPLDAFKKQYSRDPRPSEVTRLTQAGQALSGVVRPVGEGTADGCVELVDTGYCEMQHVGILHESAQAARGAAETLEVANFAFEKMKVSVTGMAAPDNPEDVSLKLKGDSKKKSSDIDDLDSLWDGVLIVSGADSGGAGSRGSRGVKRSVEAEEQEHSGPGTGEAPPSPKRRPPRRASVGRGGAKGAKGAGPSPGSKVGRRQREIAISEKVLLESTQLLRTCVAPETCLTMTEVVVSKMLAKVNSRMSEPLMEMYTAGFDATGVEVEATGSIKLLEDLRSAAQALERLLPLAIVTKPAKPSGTPTTAREFLRQILQHNEVGSPTLPAAFMGHLLARAADTACEAADYTEFAITVSATWMGPSEVMEGERVRLALLPAGDARATLQDKLISKGLCNLLRAEKKLAKVLSYVAEIMKIELLDVQPPGITAELADFCKLLWPLRADTSVTEVQQAVTRFHTDKSLRLWRPLFLLPTGKDIMDAAAKGIEQRALDDRMLLQLTELTAKVAGFVDLTKRNVVNATTGMVEIPDISERLEAREQLDAIRGRRSRECQPCCDRAGSACGRRGD